MRWIGLLFVVILVGAIIDSMVIAAESRVFYATTLTVTPPIDVETFYLGWIAMAILALGAYVVGRSWWNSPE